MGQFFKALKAGMAGFTEGLREADQPRGYVVADRPVKCPHCGETKFLNNRALLNSRGGTFLNVDWADPSATILICAQCGRIEWFAQAPDATGESGGIDLSTLRDLD